MVIKTGPRDDIFTKLNISKIFESTEDEKYFSLVLCWEGADDAT